MLPVRFRRTRMSAKAALRVGLGIAGAYGFLVGEALWARYRIGTTTDRPPLADGIYGFELPGEPIRVLLLGDSTAVGYGMTMADQTPAALIAVGLTHLLDAPIDMRSEAVVGATSADLADQIAAAIDHRPDITIVLIGANDITHQVRPAVAASRLGRAVGLLREVGSEVIVGTVPDLGTVQPIPRPLRTVVRHWSRRLARAQTVAAVGAGARVVSLADVLDPLFVVKGDALFGDDRFHPSAAGYANVCGYLVAASIASWREREHLEQHQDLHESLMSLDAAAEEASTHPGTQVVRQGRVARVLRRRR